jgi:hypothetical protein
MLVTCIAVTEYPWPNATVGAVVPDQSLTGWRIPFDSPGKPEPVDFPIPNLDKYPNKVSLESISPIFIVPVFDDTAKIPEVVKY